MHAHVHPPIFNLSPPLDGPNHGSHVYAWSNLGTVLRELGQLQESVEAHTRVCGGLYVK